MVSVALDGAYAARRLVDSTDSTLSLFSVPDSEVSKGGLNVVR